MKKVVKCKSIGGSVEMISSKSLFHRYLILASRSKHTKIYFHKMADDVKVTLDALKKIGSKIEIFDDRLEIKGFEKNKFGEIDFKESGSSLRFLLPYALIEEGEYEFTGRGRLPQRPLFDLLEVMKSNGVEFSDDCLPFRASGKLKGGEINLKADISSQYISGLLMASIFMGNAFVINLTSQLKSISYIEMTKKVMEDFGINFYGLMIDKGSFIEPEEITIEGDWSNAIVPIALGLLKGEVRIKGLKKNSYQGDARIIEILLDQGADISWEKDSLVVKKSELKPFDLDIDNNIDLFPVLSVLALSCYKRSIFRNTSRLRLKESDRLEAVMELHRKIGADSFISGEDFVVVPRKYKSAIINSYNDHRIVMAAVVASALADIVIEIEDFQAIDKSYLGFEEDMRNLGLEIGEDYEISRKDIKNKN